MAKPFSPLAAVLVAGLIALADLATKAAIVERLAYGQQIELLPLLNVVHVINQGAAFGLLAILGTVMWSTAPSHTKVRKSAAHELSHPRPLLSRSFM